MDSILLIICLAAIALHIVAWMVLPAEVRNIPHTVQRPMPAHASPATA